MGERICIVCKQKPVNSAIASSVICKECYYAIQNGILVQCEHCHQYHKKDEDCYCNSDIINIITQGMRYRSQHEPKTWYRSCDGHFVRSKGELLISDWLFHNNYAYKYEPLLPIREDDDKWFLPDFFIPLLDTYIEFWGMGDDPKYTESRTKKEEYYQSHNIEYISIEPNDLRDLDSILCRKLCRERRK